MNGKTYTISVNGPYAKIEAFDMGKKILAAELSSEAVREWIVTMLANHGFRKVQEN